MSEQASGFELYIKSPEGFELAYRVNLADCPEGMTLTDTLASACAHLASIGFVRSERLDKPARGGGNPNWKPQPVATDAQGNKITCPQCKGDLYDNLAENAERRAKGEKQRPDYACKNKQCGWVKWPPRDNGKQADDNPFHDDPIKTLV